MLLWLWMAVSLSACSASYPGIDEILTNIAAVMPDLIGMVSAASYVFGMVFVLRGVYKLKEYGDLRTMTSSNTSIMPPVLLLTIGGVLLYFPSSYKMGMETLFGYNSPLTYSGSSSSEQEVVVSAIVQILQVIGGIAFIKGVMTLNQVGSQGSQPGTLGRAIGHIVGGILAINAYGTWEVLYNTLMG